MERTKRMNTATSRVGGTSLLALTAAVTFALGLTVPLVSSAEEGTRTIATGSQIPLAPDAPDRYTVKRGDTLWDISKVFLRDAWNWPEIWYLNPQVHNPHLIYPGDQLVLTYVDGRPRVTLGQRGDMSGDAVKLSPQVRSEALPQSVTTIPYEAVSAFLARPSVLDKSQVKSAPYLVGLRDFHVIAGRGNEIYGRGIKDAAEGARYNVVHVDEPLKDPESGKTYGYRGIYVGTGAVTRSGDPAKLMLSDSAREALQGDKLFPESIEVPLDFQPRPAPDTLKGTVMAVDGVSIAGQYQVIAINRGSKDGLESGHVIGLYQTGDKIKDKYAHGGLSGTSTWGFNKSVRLPEERGGVAMVFKTYKDMSYALIMEATHPIRVGDKVYSPNS